MFSLDMHALHELSSSTRFPARKRFRCITLSHVMQSLGDVYHDFIHQILAQGIFIGSLSNQVSSDAGGFIFLIARVAVRSLIE